MSSRNRNRKARDDRRREEDDEVDTLMRAAEDEVLLKLHTVSHSPSTYLDPDLNRRFLALKTPSSHPDPVNDDLFARFAALKAPSSSIVDIDNDNVDEVEKVMRWAVDAARLDPSPQSDDDICPSSASASASTSTTDDDEEEEDHLNKWVKQPIKKKNYNP